MKFLILLLILTLSPSLYIKKLYAQEMKTITSTAYSDFENKKIAYFEVHRIYYEKGELLRSENDYLDEQKVKIAEIISDYRRNKNTPTYVFRDFRAGTEEGLRLEEDQYTLYFKSKNEKEIKKQIKPSKDTFSCQAWHYFLLDNLDLLSKNDLLLSLLFPSRLEAYSLKVGKKDESNEKIELSLEFENWVYRLFAPSLSLEYDKKNKKLLSYFGPSNIVDSKGENQKVIVIYD